MPRGLASQAAGVARPARRGQSTAITSTSPARARATVMMARDGGDRQGLRRPRASPALDPAAQVGGQHAEHHAHRQTGWRRRRPPPATRARRGSGASRSAEFVAAQQVVEGRDVTGALMRPEQVLCIGRVVGRSRRESSAASTNKPGDCPLTGSRSWRRLARRALGRREWQPSPAHPSRRMRGSTRL